MRFSLIVQASYSIAIVYSTDMGLGRLVVEQGTNGREGSIFGRYYGWQLMVKLFPSGGGDPGLLGIGPHDHTGPIGAGT